MNRNPTAQTTFARPWREFADFAKETPIGRGADPAGFESHGIWEKAFS